MPRRFELSARSHDGVLRSLPRFWWGLLLLLGASCSESSSENGGWTLVRVEDEKGRALQAFHVTLAHGDEAVTAFSCEQDLRAERNEPKNARCVAGGFELEPGHEPSHLTLRAREHSFASVRVAAGATRRLQVVLKRLQRAEATADYTTRLDGEDCLAQLEELALTLPTDAGPSHSVKFLIRDLDETPRVYFQNTKQHPLHFDFAKTVLGVEGTADEFANEVYSPDRTAIVGTVVAYPSLSGPARAATPEVEAPWTLNFFPSDPISVEQVRLTHRLIEERLTCLEWSGAAGRLVYLPATTSKEEDTSSDERQFERAGIGWMTQSDLFGAITLQTLNPGLAFGTLKRMTPEELATSPVSFRDILLLTRIPNALPVVGGTITEELQTPLAHVNVAARTRGTPNLAYPEASRDPNLSSLLGKLVRFEVGNGTYSLRQATREEAEAFWAGQIRPRFVPTYDSAFTGIPSFDEIGFADSVRVGVKAANLAELSQVLGENAPAQGLAIPFHYYEAFMASAYTSPELCDSARAACVAENRAPATCSNARQLCMPGDEPESFSDFVARLLAEPEFASDTTLREAVLANLRHSIEHTRVDPEFASLLDRRVSEVFGTAKVKLRSSTNSEDLPNFSGAGLYDSHAANGSKPPPSQVVTRVFASVWNFRAFEERSYWNIDHEAVRMGCAINRAFTDELANGVLITESIADPSRYGMYVNVQRGEVEVVNPPDGTLPEIFTIFGDSGHEIARQRFSSLSPDAPLLSDAEIASLYEVSDKARQHFAKLYGRAYGQLILDIEFKLTPEHVIVLKQARPYTPATN